MATIKPQISAALAKQLPEFIRSDYATFVAFLEAYYEWLDDNYGKRNLEDLRSIDNTLESYVQYFKNEINCLLSETLTPNCATLNQKLILRKLKDYYKAKGSEKAYEFLFRVLFNKQPELYYPGTAMLRASDGKWEQDISLFINVTSGNIDDIVGKEITITTSSGALDVFVERYETISGSVYEVFVQRFFGSVAIGDAVAYSTGFAGTLGGTTTGYAISVAGGDFTAGQIFDIESGDGGTGTKIKISEVSSSGGIETIQIIDFGRGYTQNFFATIAPTVTDFEDPSPITVDLNSVQQFSVPSNTYTNGFAETGSIISPDYVDTDYCDGTYAGTLLSSFTQTTTAGVDTTKFAVVQFTVGAKAEYPGFYSKNDGFISDAIFIQDSFYYQAYSYEVRISELLEDYKSTVKSFIHPSGLALFADYQIDTTFNIGQEVSLSQLQIRLYLSDSFNVTESLIKDITKPLTEAQTITDGGTVYALSKPVSDSQSVVDSGTALNFGKTVTGVDSVTMSDLGTTKHLQKANSDSFSLTEGAGGTYEDTYALESYAGDDYAYDLETRDVTFAYTEATKTDSFTPTEAPAVTLNKEAITESVSSSDSGSIFLNPYTFGTYFAEDYVAGDTAVDTF